MIKPSELNPATHTLIMLRIISATAQSLQNLLVSALTGEGRICNESKWRNVGKLELIMNKNFLNF